MGILLWIVFGFVVGVIAKLLTPGRDPAGFVITTVLGISGSLLGGFIGRSLGIYPDYGSAGGFVMSVVGAVILLGLYHVVARRRVSTI